MATLLLRTSTRLGYVPNTTVLGILSSGPFYTIASTRRGNGSHVWASRKMRLRRSRARPRRCTALRRVSPSRSCSDPWLDHRGFPPRRCRRRLRRSTRIRSTPRCWMPVNNASGRPCKVRRHFTGSIIDPSSRISLGRLTRRFFFFFFFSFFYFPRAIIQSVQQRLIFWWGRGGTGNSAIFSSYKSHRDITPCANTCRVTSSSTSSTRPSPSSGTSRPSRRR